MTEEVEIVSASAIYMGAAIVAGAIQCGTLRPFAVATMIDQILDEAPAIRQLHPDLRAVVEEHLRGFADLVRSMATVPSGAGRA